MPVVFSEGFKAPPLKSLSIPQILGGFDFCIHSSSIPVLVFGRIRDFVADLFELFE
jgi:hypothetical protein